MESAPELLTITESNAYPSLSDRVQSTFVDTLVIVGLMFLSAGILDKYDAAPDWIRIALFFGVWVLYEPICVSTVGTVGNHMKGIRVRKISNIGGRINFFQAFIRTVIKLCLGWLSFITIHTNKERRALHDLAVGSVMIKK